MIKKALRLILIFSFFQTCYCERSISTEDRNFLNDVISSIPAAGTAYSVLSFIYNEISNKREVQITYSKESKEIKSEVELIGFDQDLYNYQFLDDYEKECAPLIVFNDRIVGVRSSAVIIRNFCFYSADFLGFETDWTTLESSLVALDKLEERIKSCYKFRKKRIRPLERFFGKGFIDKHIEKYRINLVKNLIIKHIKLGNMSEELKESMLKKISSSKVSNSFWRMCILIVALTSGVAIKLGDVYLEKILKRKGVL